MLNFSRLMAHRVQYREEICAQLGCAIDRSIGVDCRLALVGGDLIVEVGFGVAPVP